MKDSITKQWGQPGVQLMNSVLQGFCQALHDNNTLILVPVDTGALNQMEKVEEEIKQEVLQPQQPQLQSLEEPVPELSDEDMAEMEAEFNAAPPVEEPVPAPVQRLTQEAARMTEQLKTPTPMQQIAEPATSVQAQAPAVQAPVPMVSVIKKMSWAEKLRAYDSSKKKQQQQ